jgi:Fe-S cluster biogenesis protein NfuA
MNKETLNKKVQEALNEIRPFLESDGGNIELVSIIDDVVSVKLLGNCVSCSVNQMTLKNGVEMTVKKTCS